MDEFEAMLMGTEPEETEQTSPETEQTEQNSVANPENSAEQTNTEQQAETPAEENDSFEVVYNGEKQKLNREQMIEYAQKGMNYDKVHSQREEFRKTNEELQRFKSFVDDFAKRNNMTTDQYLAAVEAERKRAAVQENVDNGMSQDAAEELVRLREENETYRQKETEYTEQEKNRQAEAERKAEIEAFVARYPDVKELPQPVLEKVNSGRALMDAYMEYENDMLRAELEGLRKQKENESVSVGSADVAGNDTADAFLDGFSS